MAKDNFSEKLISDLKKQTILTRLKNKDLDDDIKVNLNQLNNIGYNFKTKNEFKDFLIYLLNKDNSGFNEETFISQNQGTIFFLNIKDNKITDVKFSYININKSLVNICSFKANSITCNAYDVEFNFECFNCNEFENLKAKQCDIIVSCIADKVNIQDYKNINKDNKLEREIESYIPQGTYAKYLSGEIIECKKILNCYSNLMFYEIHIKCYGIDVAVLVPESKIDDAKLKVGNILRCSGVMTAIIIATVSNSLDKSIILIGKSKLKKYYICNTQNKNAICFFNVDKNGIRNDKETLIFPTLDIKEIKLTKIYNGIFSVKAKIKVKNGKGFTCYIENTFEETLLMLNNLDCIKIKY